MAAAHPLGPHLRRRRRVRRPRQRLHRPGPPVFLLGRCLTIFLLRGDLCLESRLPMVTRREQVLVDHFGSLRSGRPASFDMNSLAGVCPPLETRPADYCAKVPPRSLTEDCGLFAPFFFSIAQPCSQRGMALKRWVAGCPQAHSHEEPTQHYTIVFNVFVLLQAWPSPLAPSRSQWLGRSPPDAARNRAPGCPWCRFSTR